MELDSITKYKDELPLATINRVRGILGDIGLFTVEAVWKNSLAGFYSVTVTIDKTALSTNGKGATREFALASAYGEMLERLQNQALFRLNIDFDEDTLSYRGFYYAPDEKNLSIRELVDSSEDWLEKQKSLLKEGEDLQALLEKWKKVSYEKIPDDFIALPYFDLMTGRLSYIPIKMACKMYMSNGMCAGNTPEEALVQGIAEILERYVNMRIVRERITPPDIPFDYFQQYPAIQKMLLELKTAGNYDVRVKDCSLNEGLPVVGVIFINRDTQSYFVKFGAHPVFEIAVERTLTELMQGQDINEMLGLHEFSYNNTKANEADNMIGILVNGAGEYPHELFSSKFSYQFTGLNHWGCHDNKEMLSRLVEFLGDSGFHIFVRDVSLLGFPSYHIIIPGMSEIERMDDVPAIEEYAEYNSFKRNVRTLSLSKTDIFAEIITFIKNHSGGSASVAQMINVMVKGGLPWYYSSGSLFSAFLYMIGNEYNSAWQQVECFIKNTDGSPVFLKCLRDYTAMRADGLSDDETLGNLRLFYSEEMISSIAHEFENIRKMFLKYGSFKCWQCRDCIFNNRCMYREVANIYKKIKDIYAKNIIQQTVLAKYKYNK